MSIPPPDPPPDKRTKAVKAIVGHIGLYKGKTEYVTLSKPLPNGTFQYRDEIPCAVLPCASAKAAKLLCKVATMTHEERIDVIRETLRGQVGFGLSSQSINILIAALGFEPAPAKPEDK